MSFSHTGLQLVNRVNRRRRIGDSTSIAGLEELATLDSINKSTSEVLSARRWEFDIRHDQIATRARLQNVIMTVTAGASTMSATKAPLARAAVLGDYIVRALPVGSTEYPDTAIRIDSSSANGLGNETLTMASAIPATISTTTGELHYYEYFLPDTVRNVMRVTHQENSLTLDQVGASVEFADRFPRSQIEYDAPRVVSVGGYDISTYETGTTAPKPRLKMNVWPVPDDEYVLDYTYQYRHPALATATDTLDGIPPEVVELIVDLATSDMISTFDRRMEDARFMRRDAHDNLLAIHSRHDGMYADRATIGNWDGSARSGGHRRSLTQGRTIG